jgi:glucokinase
MSKKTDKKDSVGSTAYDFMLGIDLGGTKILAAVVDRNGHIIGSSKRKTRSERGVEDVISRIAKTAREAVAAARIDLSMVAGIGIGAPGVSDYKTGVIEFAPNLEEWTNIPLGPMLRQELGVPVIVANDVDAGTYGEVTAGAARGYNSVVGIFPGTGIGGGIVLNGRLWRGAHNAAGELGHVVVMIDGPTCGCGRRGCIEGTASRTAIENDIRGEIRGGHPSVITDIVDLDRDQITSGVLARAVELGDPLVTQVLNRAAYHLGIFTGSMINALDPECVVYGGGLVEALGDFMMPTIRATAYRQLIRPIAPENLPILEAALGDHATIIGAAMLAAVDLRELELA